MGSFMMAAISAVVWSAMFSAASLIMDAPSDIPAVSSLSAVSSRVFDIAMKADRPRAPDQTRLTSIPGASVVTFETLPDSPIPQQLAELGYDVREIGEGERILATSISGMLTMSSSSVLILLVEGSTKPIAEVRTHAGIAKMVRYRFSLSSLPPI